ncbi:MAG: L,D-transpeptidase family protein [Patescibacteria group bacterium]
MKSLAFLIVALSFLVIQDVEAASGYELKIFSETGELVRSFVPFAEGTPGSVTAADLGGDGVAEIIVGSGYGSQPLVRVFRQDGSTIGDFLAYGETFRGGVNVATCDLDGDGNSEIVTGAGYTGGPHIRVFSNDGIPTGTSFFAYSEAFRGGVNVACGDITGDGVAEIITGAGVTGGPHIRVFSAAGVLLDEAFSGSASDSTGVFVTLGDTDGDERLEVLASPMAYAHPSVTIFAWTNDTLKYRQSLATGLTQTHGSPVAAFDIDNDGSDELATSEGAFGSSVIDIVETVGSTTASVETSIVTSSSTLIPATLKDATSNHLLVLAATTQLVDATTDKYVLVDISEQRLTAYANGVPVNTFLVSTGVSGWNTPQGTTTITAKIPIMDYSWFYGAGNPNNYSLPNVKWNMRFRNHYYLHSAYWHNNFGHPMSHGCVNISIPNAEWLYDWSAVGTTVTIQN